MKRIFFVVLIVSYQTSPAYEVCMTDVKKVIKDNIRLVHTFIGGIAGIFVGSGMAYAGRRVEQYYSVALRQHMFTDINGHTGGSVKRLVAFVREIKNLVHTRNFQNWSSHDQAVAQKLLNRYDYGTALKRVGYSFIITGCLNMLSVLIIAAYKFYTKDKKSKTAEQEL